MHEFMFSQSRRELYAQRRWPDPNRVEFFLNEAENDISRWLKLWGEDRLSGNPSQIRKVGAAADRLRDALLGLDDGARRLLFVKMLSGGNRGFDYREADSRADQFQMELSHLANCASWFHEKGLKSIDTDRAQDLCDRLVYSHISAFLRPPGYGSENLFKAFLDELRNDLPSMPVIGRSMIEKAIERSDLWLEAVNARLKPLK